MGRPHETREKSRKRQAFIEAEARRAEFLRLISAGNTQAEACQALGISTNLIRKWKERFPAWVVDLAMAKAAASAGRGHYDGSFLQFRQHYLGMESTRYQARIADAIESARPGEVTMILIPPEHGKTTLLEDYCTYKLCNDPSFRVTVASETIDHGIKILERVRHRLEPDGPTPLIHRDFGPLAPEGRSQVWGQRQFDVAQRSLSDERDYSMHAVGIEGRVQGTRCDLLLLDDIQDVKSLAKSEKYAEIIKQSFLSRPSMFGRTVIIGTRVGEFDVYRLLLDGNIDDHLIRIAAYDVNDSPHWPAPKDKPDPDKPETWAPEGVKFLWPEKYDDIPGDGIHRYRYAALRYRVGEVAWARNYMQHPEAASTMTFDAATTDKMQDDSRSVMEWRRPGLDGPIPIVVALDPAIGSVNAVLTAAMYPDRMDVLHIRRDVGLNKYSQIFNVLEEEIHRYTTDNSFVNLVVIEDKAFQRGILRDDRLEEMQRRFGFRIVPNTTGKEKVDPDIGIPSIPLSMLRHEITIPWADEASQQNMEPLLRDLHIWRPGVPGAKLPQDHTMTLWFAFRQWRAVRDTLLHPREEISNWRSRPSPLRRTSMSRPTYRRLSNVQRRRVR